MNHYCKSCGKPLNLPDTCMLETHWQCRQCFYRGVAKSHPSIREMNTKIMAAPFSTHDENYVELTKGKRYE